MRSKKQKVVGSIDLPRKPRFKELDIASKKGASNAVTALIESFVEKLTDGTITTKTIRNSFLECNSEGKKRRLMTILSRVQTHLEITGKLELAKEIKELRKEFMSDV